MLIAALVLYLILGFVVGPFWPLAFLGGKAGPVGYAVVAGWLGLLIGGAH